MRKEDVPQDASTLAGYKEIAYAVDEEGNYALVPSEGWQPKAIANALAWEEFYEQLEDTRQRALKGECSPLAFHMERRQMDPTMLAEYVGMFRWRVKRHLKAKVFSRLSTGLLQRYADALKLTLAELQEVPTQPVQHPPPL